MRRSRRRSSTSTPPARNGAANRFAVATASWMARLIPTPPTGDIACAASPMHSSPGRYQRSSRSTRTVSRLTSSQPRISPMRSAAYGAAWATLVRNASIPSALIHSKVPFGMTIPHCQ